MKLRIVLFCLLVVGAIAFYIRQPRAAAQVMVPGQINYTVPRDWGEFKQFMQVGQEYWTVFQAEDGTVRIVQMERGLSAGPVVRVEIQRK